MTIKDKLERLREGLLGSKSDEPVLKCKGYLYTVRDLLDMIELIDAEKEQRIFEC